MRKPRMTSEGQDGRKSLRADQPHDLAATAVAERPHDLEHAVRRELLSQPGLRFSSLVVRRLPNGVCLEGVLEAEDDSPDIRSLVRRVAGVDQVLNHLVTYCPPRPPRKG
ncbi:MAG: BON domain-containing protein [Planctomycetales bacterium]